MAYWLIKSEPDAYSWDQFVTDGSTVWDGVRNAQASNNLKAMQPGDEAFYYHSNVGREVVGIARVTKSAFPDPKDDTGRWVAVEVEPVRPLERPVTLAQMKQEPRFKDFGLIRQSRLSVVPVREQEWDLIVKMSAN